MDQVSATGEASARKFSRAEWWMPTKRWALIGLAVGGAIGGLALGWDWVVAAGLAPLVVSVLPCIAMCALGMCAMRGQKSCHGESTTPRNGNAGQSAQATEPPRPEIPS
ncbi:MAG TPA: hypothetical protein VF969_06825 [Burkholderiales bacterium]